MEKFLWWMFLGVTYVQQKSLMIQKGQQKSIDQWLRGQLYICNKKVYGLEIHDTFVYFY